MCLLRLLSYRTPRGPQPAKLQKGLTRFPRLTRAEGERGELGRPVEKPASPKHTVLPTWAFHFFKATECPLSPPESEKPLPAPVPWHPGGRKLPM